MKDIISLTQSLPLINLDLLSVGITIAAIALLGFIVYISNTKSATSISFLMFCVVTMLWSFFNYLSYQTKDPGTSLIILRTVIFLAFWHSFTFFNFLYVFPQDVVKFPSWYKYLLVPCIAVLSLWTLFGSFVFSGMTMINGTFEPKVAPGIAFFVITVFLLVITGFIFLLRRISKAKKHQKEPYVIILIGALITFFLLFEANLILPAVFEITRFIPLGAITMFPFAVFTSYAIFKHKTFKVTNLGSSLMAFFLCIATFIEVIFAENYGQLVLRLGIFLFVLLISIQFVKNIFALETITKNLEDANVKLQSLDKLKSEFISLASHQLRSPLTVIKGYASTLTDGVLGELTPKQNEVVGHIYTSATGLGNVVEDFLSVTKIEQGGMKYVFEKTDVRKIVEDLASDMKIAADAHHLMFTSAIGEDGDYMMNVDGVKLKQVFLNLVDNSIKYTKEGFVHVELSKRSHGKEFVFSVSDSGVGVSKEAKAKLFTKFSRGESGALNSGGSGLGLYLALEIVKAHKGTITIDSEGIGKGSKFSVIIPYEA